MASTQLLNLPIRSFGGASPARRGASRHIAAKRVDQTSSGKLPARRLRARASGPIRAQAAGTEAPASPLATKTEYVNTPLDDLFLMLFRRKLVKETGWSSKKQGYEGMIEEARKLLTISSNRQDAEVAAVRILLSFFPPWLLPLFKRFLAPGFDGKLGAILSAAVTLVTCQWLMGPSKASEVELPDGSKLLSGVKIDKCRFLEETRCAGSCIHTCKMPTQAFMEEYMGVPLYMEPNYEDFSCEFKFGVPALSRQEDKLLASPCLSVCPVAAGKPLSEDPCPEVTV